MAKYKIHSTCALVIGKKRACLYDFLRETKLFISLETALFLTSNSLIDKFKPNPIEIQELISHEIIYNANKFKGFTPAIFKYDDCSYISNLVIEYSEIYEDENVIEGVINSINYLLIKGVQIIISNYNHLENVDLLLHKLHDSFVRDIEIVITISNYNKVKPAIKKIIKHNRVNYVLALNKNVETLQIEERVIQINPKLYLSGANTLKFVINRTLYSESLEFNTYFNKKMFFNKNAEILNAPEYNVVFGNVKDIQSKLSWIKIISSEKFQYYWNAKKNDCNVCRDCEYKHMCVDKRLPTKINQNLWNFSEDCNYNPYTLKWKNI